jgi:hypothetical protein
MPMTDPRITVNPEVGKQIAQVICKEIEDSLGKNSKRYKLAERCENQYAQRTIWDVKGVDCNTPWDNASNYFVALTEWIIDAIHARVMNILFSQPNLMKAKGIESTDVGKQEAVTDFINLLLKEKVKVYENTNYFFKQMIKLPFAVLKYCWVQEYDSMVTKEQATVFQGPDGSQENMLPDDPEAQIKQAEFMANGYQPVGQQDVWTLKDVELIDAAQLKYIAFRDYVYSPSAKRGQRLFWEGDRFWLTINDMMLKAQQDKFFKDSVEKIRTTSKDGQRSGVDAIIADRERMLECFHWYGRLPFNKNNEIDFNDGEAIEQEVYAVVSFKEQELLDLNHWYYNRKPWPDRVYIRECFEETEEFEGRSMSEKLYKTQGELNDLHKTLMDNAWLAMQKIFVKRRTLTGEEWEQPTVYPGAMWEEDNQGDIRTLEVGDVKAIGMELEQMLLSFAERISNITAWNLGTQAQGGGKTATEFAGVMQEGNIGRESLLQRCYGVMKKICQWTYDYYSERMPEGLERRILGPQGEEIFPSPENMAQFTEKGINPQWSQEDIAGQYDYEWQGTSQNADQQWNIVVANDLQERYLPHPMVAQNMLAVWSILKDGLVARGKKDWKNILPPKEAIIAEMKRMAQEAQARQQGQQIDQQVESKLGSQGIQDPQMQAMVKAKVMEKVGGDNARQSVPTQV